MDPSVTHLHIEPTVNGWIVDVHEIHEADDGFETRSHDKLDYKSRESLDDAIAQFIDGMDVPNLGG